MAEAYRGKGHITQASLNDVCFQKQALLGENQTLSPPHSMSAMDTQNEEVSMETKLQIPGSGLQRPPPR